METIEKFTYLLQFFVLFFNVIIKWQHSVVLSELHNLCENELWHSGNVVPPTLKSMNLHVWTWMSNVTQKAFNLIMLNLLMQAKTCKQNFIVYS